MTARSDSSHGVLLVTTVALAAAASVWLGYQFYHDHNMSDKDKTKRERDRMAPKGDTSEISRIQDRKSDHTDVEDDTRKAPFREIELNPSSQTNTGTSESSTRRILTRGSISIIHGSITGTCKRFANELYETIEEQLSSDSSLSRKRLLQLGSTQDFDWWDELINDEDDENDSNFRSQKSLPAILILVIPTYTSGTWPPVAESLEQALQELNNDWRIAKFPLKGKLQVAIFGMGSSEYNGDGDTSMGKPAKEAVRYFQRLGAKCNVKLMIGDDAVGDDAKQTFLQWKQNLLRRLGLGAKPNKVEVNSNGTKKEALSSCACSSENHSSDEQATGCCQTSGGEITCTDEGGRGSEWADANEEYDENDYDDDESSAGEPEIMDLEDMGDTILASQNSSAETTEPREMVTPSQAAALKKEGYRLIGTHSAVKLCRWTKHQLRGRGGCYKHTFYGITSYQCMEATPSLACANKCVFCWRHHKNPVGKTWRWKTDDPHYIVEQAVQTHIRMIKEAKGIPGVQRHRWEEAHTVRHCALSLVGEPIMYPRIDELLGDLHSRKISTFLVTNGQHPQAIESLRPITQLYVSVDAPTRESLIAIDRPLFSDAWDRLRQSLSSLKVKGQRTVARLTVVKGWNSDEVAGYAELIALGNVSLVEVKGVTFCGKSDASNLNMTNTPWHHEVVDLTRTLKQEIDKIRAERKRLGQNIPPEYDLACEHKHSCSVLLARVDQFAVDNPVTGSRTWRTWIDYDRFHELAARNAEDPTFTFAVEDYTAETPAWALFGSEEEGFDPTDMRHRKKKKHPKYTRFDENGIPTHDHNDQKLSEDERKRLAKIMKDRKAEIGSGSTVTQLKGGAKEVLDASLMFRGLVVAK